jgi:proteasome-associated ATPase
MPNFKTREEYEKFIKENFMGRVTPERWFNIGDVVRAGGLDGSSEGPFIGKITFGQTQTEQPIVSSEALAEAKEQIEELREILERVQKEPLILYTIDRVSKDKKHAYVKRGDQNMRIEACPKLEEGDEVLLHPKSLQIVEHLGRPPLEASRFSPDQIPNVTWADIGGLEEAKADMIEAIETPHKNKDLFKFYNKRPIKGILLSGPPGCGKTMLGKAAANSLSSIYGKENARTGFLYVKGPEILDQYVGQSEKTIRDLFFDARRHKEEHGYPAVIFLDEADAILATRGSRNVGIGNTIVPQFLTEMDGLEDSAAIVIIATNRPDVLDPAIVRDGRIDRKVTVTRPAQKEGTEILLMNLKRVPLASGQDLHVLADDLGQSVYSPDRYIQKGLRLSEVVSGAMLANVIDLAVSFAIRRDQENKTKNGLSKQDCFDAVNRVQQQCAVINHAFAA